MKIVFQGETAETSATTMAALLAERGCGADVVAELDGEVLADAASSAAPLREGSVVNVFRIVPGG